MLNDVSHQAEAVLFLRRLVEGHITNPLLLVGPEGTGRRFAALQTVKEIFCSGDRSPTCGCVDCIQVGQGTHPDLTYITTVDGKDIGVDAARSAVQAFDQYPTQSRLRFVLIEGADRMTMPAANALLKTLEEPPSSARAILIAESAKRVLPTIRSRCGVLNFRPLPESFVLASVQQFESDATKALVYTRLGEGSVGRAIQFWGSGRLSLRDKALNLLTLAVAKDVAGTFLLIDQLEKELPLALRFLGTLLHDLLLLGVDESRVVNIDVLATLKKMQVSPLLLQKLYRDLQSMLGTHQSVKIQLPFHLKTLLLQTFVGA